MTIASILDSLSFDAGGLIAAIAQQHDTGEVLMLAWMNRAALDEPCAADRPATGAAAAGSSGARANAPARPSA